ncbi:DUF1214 domain-containing protein [Rhizobium paknamense]|uniref:DUF1214 domain-containing protein n=1 Tax=Rhizobium paknamense TaxID=1206817 RepID=A0ABU0I7W8_9HYPH|nr:DUF1214 domain-containing protein [Rhizobium paknamense]MDQ0454302.1 hypothetical protein [Rhizobium paknamense]
MFRVPFLVAVALAVAFGLGIQSALLALDATVGFGEIKIGSWRAFPEAQTSSADPYARAHRAKAGRLLMGSAEGLTFIASSDDSGERLSGLCRYRLDGSLPPARAWTLYAAGLDGTPLAVPDTLPGALNSVITLKQQDGGLTVEIGSQAAPGNWLALPPGNGPFLITVTLLDTPAAGNSGLVDVAMPKIEKIGCGHA